MPVKKEYRVLKDSELVKKFRSGHEMRARGLYQELCKTKSDIRLVLFTRSVLEHKKAN